MAKANLENKVKKAILKIDENVNDISNLLKDLNSKLSHIIENKKSHYDIYYDMLRGGGYT